MAFYAKYHHRSLQHDMNNDPEHGAFGELMWRMSQAVTSYYNTQQRVNADQHGLYVRSKQYTFRTDPLYQKYKQIFSKPGESEKQISQRYIRTVWSYNQRLQSTEEFRRWKRQRIQENRNSGASVEVSPEQWINDYKSSKAVLKNRYYDDQWHDVSSRDIKEMRSPAYQKWYKSQDPIYLAGRSNRWLLFQFEEGNGNTPERAKPDKPAKPAQPAKRQVPFWIDDAQQKVFLDEGFQDYYKKLHPGKDMWTDPNVGEDIDNYRYGRSAKPQTKPKEKPPQQPASQPPQKKPSKPPASQPPKQKPSKPPQKQPSKPPSTDLPPPHRNPGAFDEGQGEPIEHSGPTQPLNPTINKKKPSASPPVEPNRPTFGENTQVFLFEGFV